MQDVKKMCEIEFKVSFSFYTMCICSCHVDIIINYTTVSFFAGEVTNATLTCVYGSDVLQVHHEFGGEIIDILDPGVNDDVR